MIILHKTISVLAHVFFTISFTLLGFNSFSQEKVFLNVNQEVTEEKFAYYTQEFVKDSAGAHCIKITFNNGNTFFEGCLLNSIYTAGKERKYIGSCRWYYKNGNLQQNAHFNADGKMDGEVASYHENGDLKTKAKYKNGIRTTKKMTFKTESGNSYTLFQEDFTSNANDWEVYKSELNEAYIEDNKFVLNSLSGRGTSRYIEAPIKSNSYEIELEIAPASDKKNAPIKGLIYDYSSWDNYSYFIIQDIYFSVGKMVDGSHRISADLLSTIRINTEKDASNVLKIKNEYDASYYFINDELVHKSSPQKIKFDRLGMIVGGNGFARFNQLSVKEFESDGFDGSIEVEDEDIKGSGTGFLISDDGYIITNHHVIEDANKIFIEFPALNKTYATRLVIKNKTSDLALLKIEDSTYNSETPVPYVLSSSVKDVGSSVFALGYPLVYSGMGKEVKFADGKVSSKTGYDNDIFGYQTTVPVQPGNSGSPMFDDSGDVVGCMNAIIKEADNVSYSIKSNFIRTFVQSSSEEIILPTENKLKGLDLTEQIKKVSNHICIVKVL
mgnify:CR=1 FL=1